MHSYTAVVRRLYACDVYDYIANIVLLPAQLIALRLLIGVFEAGFYPTALFYLSNFYTRFDLAVRIALFYGQYAVAGAFSGAIGTSLLVSTLYTANYPQRMGFSI
jgi:MFS family permease